MNFIIKSTLIIILILVTITVVSADSVIDKIETFVKNDTTNEKIYLPWYSCGHFSRDLARNASKENLPIGSILLSNHPVFRGRWNSHAMNYFKNEDQIILIEPQTDRILTLEQSDFKYYRLYPDGTQVPSNWRVNLAATGKIRGK